MNLMKTASVIVPAVLFLLMAFAVAQTDAWQVDGIGGAEDIDEIVHDIFTQHLVAFEVLGVLLTAAMIGALVIARPLVSGLDSDHYPRADAEQLKRSQDASELTASFTVTPMPPLGPRSHDAHAPAGTPPAADIAEGDES